MVQAFGSDTNVNFTIGERVRKALQTISYDTVGSVPGINLDGPVDFLYERKAARSILSEYTGLFRDDAGLRITYVDAGRPSLFYGNNGTRWTIYADEISEFNTVVEAQKNALEINLPEYYLQYNSSVEQVEATAGRTYFVDLDPPCNSENIIPAPTSVELINSERLKFKAAATTTYTVTAYEILGELQAGNDPYVAQTGKTGVPYKYDFDLPLFNKTGGGSLTKDAVNFVLDRSNIMYEFTYRGNPEIQPRDILEVEVATWENGSITKLWETMTVDTITLEHGNGGGFASKITARKGVV